VSRSRWSTDDPARRDCCCRRSRSS
jgi:hypothetical protein